jgi:hypothetical protein
MRARPSRNAVLAVLVGSSAALAAATVAAATPADSAASAAGPAGAGTTTTAARSATTNPALERFKALAGEWLAAEDTEMVKKGDLVSRYAVTANGSAVVETILPGTPHEMVTVYHADGSDLVLTHYCTEGNQPRMRARAAAGPRYEFAFDGGTNIDPAHDRHMHSATVDLVGPDELRSEWNEIADGKPVLVARIHVLRKAR